MVVSLQHSLQRSG